MTYRRVLLISCCSSSRTSRSPAPSKDTVRALMARSVRVDPDDPAWQRLARRREWLRHWPGVLSP